MATAQSESSRTAANPRTVEFERFIDSQVRKARRQVRWIDLAAGMMTLAAGALLYLLVAAMLDHWVVRGGLGFGGRIASLLVLAAGAGAYFVYALLPPIMRSVNPVYAAQTIERSHPTLKNSLVNLLLLRSSRRGVARSIYEGLEAQTAAGLSGVHVDQAIDRSRLVKLGWMLLGIVAVGAVYTLASPKDPLRSIGRIIAPWADIAAPTRVAIRDVQPGAARAFHDDFVEVSAEVTGIDAGEPVTLFFTTSDDQAVNQPVEMKTSPGEFRYRAELPPSAGGIQQDLVYYIAAGDAVSPKYRIDVLITPSIVVDRVDYAYPEYTEIKPRSVERRGDLTAIDGTRVTVLATANDDIRSAYVDFDCDGRRDLPMRVDGRTATASFLLALKPDGSGLEHASYQLRFQNADGAENPKPVRYEIQVTPDEPPTVAIVDPSTLDPETPWEMAADDVLGLRIEGEDPDFKLSALSFVAEKDGRTLAESPLLAEPRGGVVDGDYLLNPHALGLKAGDTVTFWAVANDNRQPRPNRAETPHYTLRVMQPQAPQDGRNADPPQQPRQQPRNEDKNQKRPDQQRQERQQPGEASDDSQPAEQGDRNNPPAPQQQQERQRDREPKRDGEQPDDQQREKNANEQGDEGQGDQGQQSDASPSNQQDSRQQGKRGDSGEGQGEESESKQGAGDAGSQEPPDADSQPGDVFDTILERARQQQQPSNQPQDQPEPGEREEQASDDSNQDQETSGDKRPQAGDPSSDPQQGSQASSENEQGEQPQQGNQKPNDKNDNQQGSQEQNAGNQDSGNQEANEQRGDKRDGRQQADNHQTGDKSPGEQPQGEKQDGDKQDGEQSNNQDAGEENREAKGEGARNAGDKPQDRPGTESGSEQSPGDGSSTDKQGADENGQPQGQGSKTQKPDAGQGGEPSQTGDPMTGDNPQPDASQPKPGESAASRESNQQDATGAEPSPGGQSGEPAPGTKVEREKRNGRDAQKLPDDARLPAERNETGEPQSDKQPSEDQGEPGKGDQTRGAGEQGEKSDDDQESKQQTGGENSEHSQGDPGAGEKAGSDGSPSPQEGNRPREKSTKPASGDSDQQPEQKANSPSGSRNQSDSQSSQSGDQSGGGKDGGGQRSNQSGTGSAGQNMESDQGAGVGQQSGDGVTGQQGGDQQVGDSSDPNAQTQTAPGDRSQAGGQQAGPGQETPRPMTEGDRAAGAEQRPQPGEDQAQQPQPSPNGQQPPQPSPGQNPAQNSDPSQPGTSRGGGNPAGGGLPGDDDAAAQPPRPPQAAETPAGDDPNLEYTRKATDLALQYLKDQLQDDKVDQELLDDLQWSREDMERFVRQWEAMKKDAARAGSDGEQARRKLDDALRGLGLRPQGTTIRGGQRHEQRGPTVRDSRRSSPPPEYVEQYKAYTSGSGREE